MKHNIHTPTPSHDVLMAKYKHLATCYELLANGYAGIFALTDRMWAKELVSGKRPVVFHLNEMEIDMNVIGLDIEEKDDEDATMVSMFKVKDQNFIGITNGDYEYDLSKLPDDILNEFLDYITDRDNIYDITDY